MEQLVVVLAEEVQKDLVKVVVRPHVCAPLPQFQPQSSSFSSQSESESLPLSAPSQSPQAADEEAAAGVETH